jgi:hypothetical protein
MASTYKFHSQVGETVPWQAQYTFPTQATRVNKATVKIPPKNGGVYSKGDTIRIEFPADSYLNPMNSYLAFDFKEKSDSITSRFQRGGAQNLIKRCRILYGSMVLEDIQEYKTLVRLFSEAAVSNDYATSCGSILDGMSGPFEYNQAATAAESYSQNSLLSLGGPGSPDESLTDSLHKFYSIDERTIGRLLVNNSNGNPRRFVLNLMSGLLTSKKLIPLKWMASQLTIELTLADELDAMMGSDSTIPGYQIENVDFVAELIEFDSTYDSAFFSGLTNGGVPLKFSSWHYHTFSVTGANQMFQIHERSRSVKSAFAVVRDTGLSVKTDSDKFYHACGEDYDVDGLVTNRGAGTIDEFQWRVGGRYYPAQPVQVRKGGAEAFAELSKAVNALGDYTRPSHINFLEWTTYNGLGTGSKFIMACEFENVDVVPDTIAGLNAEEQSDIALSVKMSAPPAPGKKLDIFMNFDALLVIRDGNVVDLIM